MKSITPCLWFDGQGEAAAALYTSLFPNSKINQLIRFTKAGFEHHRQLEGSVMTVAFSLFGEEFLALNGGPSFSFNPSLSNFLFCKTAEQADHFWTVLSAGGTTRMPLDAYPWSKKYGWTTDRFGVEWQIFLSDEGREGISPALLFTNKVFGQGQAALNHYLSRFKDSKLHFVAKNDEANAILHAQFQLAGRNFVLCEGPGEHKTAFNEALSFIVNCDTQSEIDMFWESLSEGGSTGPCGWLKDKFGVSWQVAPALMGTWMSNPDPSAVERLMQVSMQSTKYNIEEIEAALLGDKA